MTHRRSLIAKMRTTYPTEVAASMVEVLPRDRICHFIPDDYETVVFEGAQGVLLDEWYGFNPYTTWSTVTVDPALELAASLELIANCDSRVPVATVGITRSHMVRHGPGPLPTEVRDHPDLEVLSRLDFNQDNKWQHKPRYGPLDLMLLNYAVRATGPIDNIAVTWLDHFPLFGGAIATGYKEPGAWMTVFGERVPLELTPWNVIFQQDITFPRSHDIQFEHPGIAVDAVRWLLQKIREATGILNIIRSSGRTRVSKTYPRHASTIDCLVWRGSAVELQARRLEQLAQHG